MATSSQVLGFESYLKYNTMSSTVTFFVTYFSEGERILTYDLKLVLNANMNKINATLGGNFLI